MMSSARWSDDIGPDDWIDVEKPREYLETLEAVARSAGAVHTAWTRAHHNYEPSGSFEPENEHLEIYMDIAWALLVPMGQLGVALADLEAHVHREQLVDIADALAEEK